MELQGLGRRARLLLTLLAVPAALLAPLPAAAEAAGGSGLTTGKTSTTPVDPNTPVLVSSQHTPPHGYRLTAAAVERIAVRAPAIVAELRRHPRAKPYEYTKGPGQWQVSWFSAGKPSRELAQVYVDDATGQVTQAWTGFQVAWSMARGYPGAFGRRVNAWYIWVPMCLLFVAPFLPLTRRARRSGAGWSLLHLDLLMLLGFSVSLALFNHANIGLSVPLVYPFLLYLLVRMLLLGLGRGRPRRPLPLIVPVSWLSVAVLFLVGFRVGLNVTNSNVIDVGYAGVIGADKLIHGKPLYGHWPSDNGAGDTYGPVTYYAYVPFRAIFGWSGRWDDLPAAHAAAIALDLLMLIGLFFLGRQIRGPTLGTLLAYAWAAYPFSLWTLSSNTNDTLVGLLVVAALLALNSPPGRGFLGGLAALTKFAPLALAPLLVRGTDSALRPRRLAVSGLAYAVALAAAMLPVFLDRNLHTFWKHTISYQSGRTSPFSVWGLWGGLSLEQHLVEGAVVALAIGLALVPRRRGPVELAALAGAIVIAVQLAANYWLYSYIVWFFPMVIVAIFGAYGARDEVASGLLEPARAPARSRPPAVALTP